MSSSTHQTDALLKSLNLSQLRDLALTLTKEPEKSPSQSKGREELLDEIRRTGDSSQIARIAERLETVAPYKHVFLFSLSDPSSKLTFSALAKAVEVGFPHLSHGKTVKPQLGEMTPQVTIFDPEMQRIYIKFLHIVESWNWERISPTKKEMRHTRRRHPVVITLRPAHKIVTVGFPGFTQGAESPTKERKTYSDIAKQARELFMDRSGIQLRPLALKPAIEALILRDKNVIDIRRLIEGPLGGKMMFYSGEQAPDLVRFVVTYFKDHANIHLSEAHVRMLFKSAEALDILLLWKNVELLTRAAFHDAGPELLFIWRGTPAETSRVDAVLRSLAEYEQFASKPDLLSASDFVEKSAVGDTIRPSWLAQQFNLSSDESLAILNEAARRSVVAFVFRVRTDAVLHDFENIWRKRLSDFPRSVTDEHGQVIDLTDSSQIEVAFERIAK